MAEITKSVVQNELKTRNTFIAPGGAWWLRSPNSSLSLLEVYFNVSIIKSITITIILIQNTEARIL